MQNTYRFSKVVKEKLLLWFTHTMSSYILHGCTCAKNNLRISNKCTKKALLKVVFKLLLKRKLLRKTFFFISVVSNCSCFQKDFW